MPFIPNPKTRTPLRTVAGRTGPAGPPGAPGPSGGPFPDLDGVPAGMVAQTTGDNGVEFISLQDTIATETADKADAAAVTTQIAEAVTGIDPLATDSTRLRNFRVALANALNEPLDVLCVGDSVTEGYGATSINSRWCNLLLARLRTHAGVLDGGEGYVPAFYEDTTKTDRFTGGTFTTSGGLFGLGIRCIRLTAGTVSFTFDGTGVDVIFAVGAAAGQFTWNIDGGTESANNATYSASNQGGCCFISARGLAPGSHTVNITHKTATIYIEGAMVYNNDEAAGVRLVEAAHASYQAYSYTVLPYWATSITPIDIPWALPAAAVTARIDPQLVTIMLGLNDYATNSAARRTAAQFKADLAGIINLIRTNTTTDPSILLVIPWERTTNGTLLSTWAEYRQAYYEAAAEDGQVAILDLKDTIGSFVDGDPYNLDVADGLHLSDKGYRVVADRAFNVLVNA